MNNTEYKQTEVGLIPKDWDELTFKDICWVNQGLQIPISKRLILPNKNSKVYITIQYLNDGKTIEYIDDYVASVCCNKEDILMTRTGNTGIVVSGVEGVFHNNFFKINFDRYKFDKDYLVYYLNQSKTKKIILAKAGISTIPDLNHKDFYSIPIPLPPTKAEQTAIATALSDADALISSLEKLIAKKRNIKQGAIQKLLQPKEGWEVKKLGEKSDIYRGGSPRPIESFLTIQSDGINWIKIGDVKKNAKYIESTDEKIISEGLSRSRFVNEGDFLLSNSMSFGRPYIMKISGCIHDGWLVIQNYQNNFDRDFLYYVLGSEAILQQYKAMASGSSVLNLNKEIVKNVVINCPKSVEEQAHIAKILSDMDEEIISLETKLEKYKKLKLGMMQNLLTGKIRLV